MQISRLSSGKSFVDKRKKFVFNAFIDFKPMQRFENRGDVIECGSPNHSLSKSLNSELLEDDLFEILEGCSTESCSSQILNEQ